MANDIPEEASGALLLHNVQQILANTSASHAASLQQQASMSGKWQYAPAKCVTETAGAGGRHRLLE